MRRGGQDCFFHTDDQGNALALTKTGGTVAELYYYDDYGAVTFLTSDGIATGATSSAVGNPYCWHGLRLDAETGLQNDGGGGYLETQSARPLRAMFGLTGTAVTSGTLRYMLGLRGTALVAGAVVAGNNPWSGGGGGGGTEMKNGTVKFFNDAKGFGRSAGGPTIGPSPGGGIFQLKRQCLFNLGLKG